MKFFLFLLAGLFIVSTSQSQNTSARKNNTAVYEVQSYVIPVLRDRKENAIQRIRIFVPAGQQQSVAALQVKLNTAAVQYTDSLKFYFGGSEPQFLTANVAAAVAPSTNMRVPMQLTLKPGNNYIWISAKAKPSALSDDKLSFTPTSLTLSGGAIRPIKDLSQKMMFYPGIALRQPWQDSVHTYRIPGIVTTNAGTLIAVYDNRYTSTVDLPGNIDVGMSRSTDGGKTWEPMKVIMDMGEPHRNNGIGDPAVLFDPRTKTIWVAALWSKGNNSLAHSRPGLSPDSSGQFVLVKSMDDGKTWSAPINITEQVKDPKWHIYFNGPGNGIAMQNGTLVFPSQYWDENKLPWSAVIYSKDNGKTWKSGTGAIPNTTESQVVETDPGTLMLNMRNNRGNFRSVSISKDFGHTWTEHVTSYNALPDPVCMASIIKARVNVNGVKRDVLFFSNVNSQTARHRMTIKASLDMGETWLPVNELMIDERHSFGYSCLTKIDDNTIGILYEGARDLNFMRVPVADIITSTNK